jgi:kinesin family protein C1
VLPDDGAGSEPPVISYPTSTEALGRGIDVIQSGMYMFLIRNAPNNR